MATAACFISTATGKVMVINGDRRGNKESHETAPCSKPMVTLASIGTLAPPSHLIYLILTSRLLYINTNVSRAFSQISSGHTILHVSLSFSQEHGSSLPTPTSWHAAFILRHWLAAFRRDEPFLRLWLFYDMEWLSVTCSYLFCAALTCKNKLKEMIQ